LVYFLTNDNLRLGGMFVPLTFIVIEARAHGFSEDLANYLVPILNAARFVCPLTKYILLISPIKQATKQNAY